jgi:hypothetical protein
VVDEPQPRHLPVDATHRLAIGEHVVVFVLPLAGRARELGALEDELCHDCRLRIMCACFVEQSTTTPVFERSPVPLDFGPTLATQICLVSLNDGVNSIMQVRQKRSEMSPTILARHEVEIEFDRSDDDKR